MLKKLKTAIKDHIVKNHNSYIFLVMAFILGVSAGAFTVNGLSAMQRDELSGYLEGFMQLFNNQSLESSELFITALIDNLKLVGLLWVLGVTIIGIPFIYIIFGVKGFITGFSSGFIINALGMSGIFFVVFALLLKEIIIVPCLVGIGVNGINFSLSIAKNKSRNENLKDSIKTSFISYCLVTAFLCCIILAGIMVDAYITPIFIRMIAPYILK